MMVWRCSFCKINLSKGRKKADKYKKDLDVNLLQSAHKHREGAEVKVYSSTRQQPKTVSQGGFGNVSKCPWMAQFKPNKHLWRILQMAVPTLPTEKPPERRVETGVFAKVDYFKSLNYHKNEIFIICINMSDTLIDVSTVLMCHI